AGMNVEPARSVLPLARAAAQRALDIDPSLPEAHAELAAVAIFLDYDWTRAGHHFGMAMARDPVPSTVTHWYGFFYLMPLGRITEAIHELERSLKEDPLNPVCGIQLGVLNWSAGRYGEASRQFRHAQELDANLWLAGLVPALCYANEDRNEEALAMAERAYAVAPTNPLCSGVLAGLVSRGVDSERGEQLKRGVSEGTAYGVPLGRAMYHH